MLNPIFKILIDVVWFCSGVEIDFEVTIPRPPNQLVIMEKYHIFSVNHQCLLFLSW